MDNAEKLAKAIAWLRSRGRYILDRSGAASAPGRADDTEGVNWRGANVADTLEYERGRLAAESAAKRARMESNEEAAGVFHLRARKAK